MYELVIKNGVIIDGTGAPGYHCDIGVSDGKIVRIARNIIEDGNRVIDAKGLVVTPGFIDSHSHSDNAMLDFPDMVEKIEQGITTSIGGQCGITSAPLPKTITEENAKEVAGYGKQTDVYKTFGTLINIAKDIPFGSNLMSFVGHLAIRKAVLGDENVDPTAEEMEKMKALVREAMENGAIGISFGLIYTPSCYSKTEELIQLAKVVKEYDGMISAHIRDEGFEVVTAVEEFLTVVKAADVKGVISHHKSAHKENWGKVNHTLRMIEDAVKEGYDVYCDVYPYTASHTSLVSTVIAKEFRNTDNKGAAKIVSDLEMRKKIKEAFGKKYGLDLSHLQITVCKNHPEYQGMRISEIAKLRGQEHFETALDIIKEAEGGVSVCNFSMCEEDVETVMKYERSMICTDSSVAKNNKVFHPRLKATFPRALGRYVRERNVVSLHEMIRKCTSMPASVYGLPSKGLLREGFDADICIFDADRIIDKAEFGNCTQRSEGINYVILDGEVVVENSIYNGKRKGKFISRCR